MITPPKPKWTAKGSGSASSDHKPAVVAEEAGDPEPGWDQDQLDALQVVLTRLLCVFEPGKEQADIKAELMEQYGMEGPVRMVKMLMDKHNIDMRCIGDMIDVELASRKPRAISFPNP